MTKSAQLRRAFHKKLIQLIHSPAEGEQRAVELKEVQKAKCAWKSQLKREQENRP